MNPIVDTIMVVLFVLFMIFIFQGYHHSKYTQRQDDEGKDKNDAGESKSPSNTSEQ